MGAEGVGILSDWALGLRVKSPCSCCEGGCGDGGGTPWEGQGCDIILEEPRQKLIYLGPGDAPQAYRVNFLGDLRLLR